MEAKTLRRSSAFSDYLLSFSGGGPHGSDEDELRKLIEVKKSYQVREGAESPSIKLRNGIGDHRGSVIKYGKALLTAAQLGELQRQVIIYKYIAAGLPVPSSLVLPISKNVASSFGFDNGGNHRLNPSFVGFSPLAVDYRNMMDPEPGRCRRTDGKKWRCKRNVVSGQKYCERHMHRGRQRLRKTLEVDAPNAIPLNNSSKTPQNSKVSGSSSIHCNTACSEVDAKMTGSTKAAFMVSCPKSISASLNPRVIAGCVMIPSTVPTDSTITTAIVGTNEGRSNKNHKTETIVDMNVNCSENVSLKNLIGGNNSRNITNTKGLAFQGLNFSPKSVLQVQNCGTTCLCRNYIDVEPGRCKRTDGKKWRCRRDVVPSEKYCEMHMHRGAKKRVEASQSPALLNANPEVISTTSSCMHPTAIFPKRGHDINLNTNLSISIAANPQPVVIGNSSDTTISNNSDTTISNPIIASCKDGDFSS
ncbi:growth-regulating factor 9 isoform X2 [Manihot esculenta]|uniref:growth-regulating factor 9 isoform X2 n=1 Tax=Manihot esculenta TaxID=3983 RepID=UPI001CC81866|nr:growth-regulating factor 9 isoform X2 [Manihot esculenta]